MIDRDWRRNDDRVQKDPENNLNRDHSDSSILPTLEHESTPQSSVKRLVTIASIVALSILLTGLGCWGIYEFYLKDDPEEVQVNENEKPTLSTKEVVEVDSLSFEDFPVFLATFNQFFEAHSSQSKSKFSSTLSNQIYHYNTNSFSNKDQLLRQIYPYWNKVRQENHSNIKILELSKIESSPIDFLAVKFSSEYKVIDRSGNQKDLFLKSTIKFDENGKITFYDSVR